MQRHIEPVRLISREFLMKNQGVYILKGVRNKFAVGSLLPLFLCSLFMISLSSCEKGENPYKDGYPVSLSVVAKSVEAGVLQNGMNASLGNSSESGLELFTKAAVSDVTGSGATVTWEASDKLGIMAVTAAGNTASAELSLNSSSENSAVGTFIGTLPTLIEVPQNCMFVYPSSCDLVYSGGTVSTIFDYNAQNGKHNPFMFGSANYSTKNISATMHHVGGMLKVAVPTGVKSIVVKGNAGETLTPFIYTYPAASIGTGEGVEGSALGSITAGSVTGSATDGSAATSFTINLADGLPSAGSGLVQCYIAMPPVKFEKGFSLLLYDGVGGTGNVMYKSYNFANGGTTCDFRFPGGESGAAGSTSGATGGVSGSTAGLSGGALYGCIVELPDVTAFEAFGIGVSATAEHTYENGSLNGETRQILNGSKITIGSFSVPGIPMALISDWGIEVIKQGEENNASATIYRSISQTDLGGKKPNAVTASEINAALKGADSWPYIPKGNYSVRPYIVMATGDGSRTYGNTTVTMPAPAVSVSGSIPMTSYSYYTLDPAKGGGAGVANGKGGSTIEGFSSVVNITPTLLDKLLDANGNYKYTYSYTLTDHTITRSGNTYSCGELTNQDWKSYDYNMSINIDGVTTGSTSGQVHVTGLPYINKMPNNTDKYKWIQTENSNTSVGWNYEQRVKTGGSWLNPTYTYYYGVQLMPSYGWEGIYFNSFHVPINVNVAIDYSFYKQNGSLLKEHNIYCSGTSISNDKGSNNAMNTKSDLHGVLKPVGNASEQIKIESYYGNLNASDWYVITSVTIKYR